MSQASLNEFASSDIAEKIQTDPYHNLILQREGSSLTPDARYPKILYCKAYKHIYAIHF